MIIETSTACSVTTASLMESLGAMNGRSAWTTELASGGQNDEPGRWTGSRGSSPLCVGLSGPSCLMREGRLRQELESKSEHETVTVFNRHLWSVCHRHS